MYIYLKIICIIVGTQEEIKLSSTSKTVPKTSPVSNLTKPA